MLVWENFFISLSYKPLNASLWKWFILCTHPDRVFYIFLPIFCTFFCMKRVTKHGKCEKLHPINIATIALFHSNMLEYGLVACESVLYHLV